MVNNNIPKYNIGDKFYRYHLEDIASTTNPDFYEYTLTEWDERNDKSGRGTLIRSGPIEWRTIVWKEKLEAEFARDALGAALNFIRESIQQVEYHKEKISLYHKWMLEVLDDGTKKANDA